MLPLAVRHRSIEVDRNVLPIAVIGAGPVGLAAAAHLVKRGATPLVLEAGPSVGASVLGWGQVRIFSPWKYNVDPAARELLDRGGWSAPDGEGYPTGRELVEAYLRPLAATREIAPHLRLRHRVTAITRLGFDKMKTIGREDAPFAITVATPAGEQEILARGVIDASGTYTVPNPLGASGTAARGEAQASDRIFYGIADVLGRERARYAGRRVLVVGSGHSAFDVLIDLAQLAEAEPRTTVTWLVRRAFADSKYGGAANDALPARGALGTRMRGLVDRGAVRQMVLRISELRTTSDGVYAGDGESEVGPFDEIIATTGFRPDLAPLRELRVRLDDVLEAPPALAPLIDPNVHSCGTVPPHGARELEHPEKDFYIVGMKSYGRAPTFLMLTGYEQVRSIASALVGDSAGAANVELVLPQTGVCSGGPGSDCCDDAATDCGSPTSTCCGTSDAVIPLASLTTAQSR
jgi:thioredoxin reductase